jgi:hypothetical protein
MAAAQPVSACFFMMLSKPAYLSHTLTPPIVSHLLAGDDNDVVDLSLVSGYNIPVKREVRIPPSFPNSNAGCSVGGYQGPVNTASCPSVKNDSCPPELRHRSPFNRCKTTGACWDISQAVVNALAIIADSREGFGTIPTKRLLKFSKFDDVGALRNESDWPTVGSLAGPTSPFHSDDPRPIWQLFGCW